MMNLIFDTDLIGDDLLTVFAISGQPDVHLKAITAYGRRIGSRRRLNIVSALLTQLNMKDVDLVPGADVPLVRDPIPGCTFCDRVIEQLETQSELEPSNRILACSAAEYIADAVSEKPGYYSLLCTGPLTNLALAVSIRPDIVDKFKSITIMGGTYEKCGNSSATSEANIYNDPEAAAIVFSRFKNINIVGLDVTLEVCLTRDSISTAPVMEQFLKDLVCSCCDAHVAKSGESIMPLHDTLAFFSMVEPNLLTFRKAGILIETRSTLSSGRMFLDFSKTENTHNFAIDVDRASALGLFKQAIANLG